MWLCLPEAANPTSPAEESSLRSRCPDCRRPLQKRNFAASWTFRTGPALLITLNALPPTKHSFHLANRTLYGALLLSGVHEVVTSSDGEGARSLLAGPESDDGPGSRASAAAATNC